MKPPIEAVPDLIVRPSMKLVRAGYTAIFCVFAACVLAYTNWGMEKVGAWILLIPGLLFLWPLSCQLKRKFTCLTLEGGKLRFETGMLTRSKRVIQLAKVQDVRVVQRLSQRILGTGDISVETAGETSLLTMQNVDNPDAVTDAVLKAAHLDSGEQRPGQNRV